MKPSLKFNDVEFVKSASKEAQYPVIKADSGRVLPEIAIAGRSNVGKSSLLNHLFRRKGLVKTSTTPGKTQLLNFFTVDKSVTFVDLPGYGFAKVPLATRRQWGPMVQTYLEKREPLKLILFLFDIRRIPNAEDLQLLQWIVHANKAMILVLTKVDKVTKNVKLANTQKILNILNLERLHHVHVSVPDNLGRHELLSMISDALVDEGTEAQDG